MPWSEEVTTVRDVLFWLRGYAKKELKEVAALQNSVLQSLFIV